MRCMRSFRFQLLIAVNSAMALLLAVFLSVDYQREIVNRVSDKHVSLVEEAQTLLPATSHLRGEGLDSVQRYIDDVCGQMREANSPGHHIVVCMDDVVLQAMAHHRASVEIFEAMEAAAASPTHRANFDDEELVVGVSRRPEMSVYVSEYLTNIRNAARTQVLRRIPRIVSMGIVAAIVVNLVFIRLAARPLQQLVRTVHQIAQGQFGAQTQPFKANEFRVLAEAINAMSLSLAETERQRRSGMKRARAIQESILPGNAEYPGMEVARVYQPAEDVAGDYYDILALPDGSWLLCIADVTGHGIPAAMSAMMLKTLLLHASEHHPRPNEILQFINNRMLTVCRTDTFTSMFVARCDLQTMTLECASAGHETCLFLSQDGRMRELRSTGLLLAVTEDARWESETLELTIGDRILLTTDGVSEAFSPQKEMFGRKRLAELFERCQGVSLTQMVGEIEQAVHRHQAGQASTDDVTVLAAQFGGVIP